jgi:peptidoglycan/LPS O-acetylase OafA/YrhL
MGVSLAHRFEEKRQFHTLDGLRGIAAIIVVLHHYKPMLAPLNDGSGYLAVDIFFVMSGFVIPLAYEGRLERIRLRGFLLARIVRLYPLYLFGLALGVAVPAAAMLFHLGRGHWTFRSLLVAALPGLLILPNIPYMTGPPLSPAIPGADNLFPLDYVAWSLFFELAINLVYASLRNANQRIALPVIMAVSAVALVIAIATRGSADGGYKYWDMWIGAARVGYSFFAGVVLFRLYRRGGAGRFRLPPYLLLALVTLLLYLTPPAGLRPYYDGACILVLLPLLVWLCICTEPRIGQRVCATLGLISYPLYLIHIPLQFAAEGVLDRLFHSHAERFAPWLGLGLVAMLVSAAYLLAITYDVWARRRLGALVGQRAPRVP